MLKYMIKACAGIIYGGNCYHRNQNKSRNYSVLHILILSAIFLFLNSYASFAQNLNITKVRVGYQSLETHSAYPLSTEPVRLVALIYVDNVPYTDLHIVASDGPIWMTGSEGFGISGPNMSVKGRNWPERIIIDSSSIHQWKSNWDWPNIDWFEVGHWVFPKKEVGKDAKDRYFNMAGKPVFARSSRAHFNELVSRAANLPIFSSQNQSIESNSLKSGTRRFYIEVNGKKQWLYSKGADRESKVFPEAFATRIAVRDASVPKGDPFLEYASMFQQTPYSWGGYSWGGSTGWDDANSSSHGIDCSGLIEAAMQLALRETSGHFEEYSGPPNRNVNTASLATGGAGALITKPISRAEIQPGDLLVRVKSKKHDGHVVTIWSRNADAITIIEAAGGDDTTSVSKPSSLNKWINRDDYKGYRLIKRSVMIHGNIDVGKNPIVSVTPPLDSSHIPQNDPPKPIPNNNNIPIVVIDPHVNDPHKDKLPYGAPVRFVYVDGHRVPFVVRPFPLQGVVMAQVRPVLETADFTVNWVPRRDLGWRRVEAYPSLRRHVKGDPYIILVLKQTAAKVNDRHVVLERTPRLISERSMAPLSFVTQLGWHISYDPKLKRVDIRTRPASSITGSGNAHGVRGGVR